MICDEKFRSKVACRALHRAKKFDKWVLIKKVVEVLEKGVN